MSIRLDQHVVDEVHEFDAAVAQARPMVTTSEQQVVAAQEETTNKSIDLSFDLGSLECTAIRAAQEETSNMSTNLSL
ncbi:MAG: hypothetical protein ABJQ90_18755 [Parasphingorhabdus sp.]